MNLSVRAGLSGVAAAAVALGIAELVAVGTGPLSAPLLAVGGVVVDGVPGPIKDAGIAIFGVHDKTALITGTAILLGAYAWLVGLIALRSRRVAIGGIVLFGVVGVAAAVTRHDAGVLAALPSLVGAALAVPVLLHLLRLAGAPAQPPDETSAPADGYAAVGAGAPTGTPGKERQDTETQGARRTGTETLTAEAPTPGAHAVGTPRTEAGGVPRTKAPTGPVSDAAAGAVTESDRVGSDGNDGDWTRTPTRREKGVAAYALESRRRFLKAVGIVVGVAALGGLAGRLLTGRRAVNAARNDLALPQPVSPAPAIPAGAQLPDAGPFVTPTDEFYRIDTALYPPQVDPRTWELRIHGMVRNPITITFDDLLAMPMVERYVTLACVSNEVGGDLIGNARWLGTPIKALLDRADPLPGADQVVQRSVDGWTCGTPTSVLRDGRDALLAVGMNGVPLPIEHGFPARMVVPGLYGYVSACKWITEIELSRFSDFDAYWVPRGWSAQGPIKTQSRIDNPADGATKPLGPVVVAGVAWAQHVGISKVEVQVDGEPWQEATLAGTVSSDTWRQWFWRWQPSAPGTYTLRVRATDINGETQTSTPAPPAPDGAQGWHNVQVSIE